MAKNDINVGNGTFCWSDPYIVMTEGASGTGPLRKEVIEETSEQGTELILEPLVYPNPTTGIIQVKLPTQSGTLQIFNSLGVLMNSLLLNTSESNIDLSMFASGVYTLQIQTEIKTTHTRLIISE